MVRAAAGGGVQARRSSPPRLIFWDIRVRRGMKS